MHVCQCTNTANSNNNNIISTLLSCFQLGSVASQMQAVPCGGCAVPVLMILNSERGTSAKQVVLLERDGGVAAPHLI